MFSEKDLLLQSKNNGDFLRMLKAKIIAKREKPAEIKPRKYNCTDMLVRPVPKISGQKICRCCFAIGQYSITYFLENELIYFCSTECFRYYTSEIPKVRGKVAP